RRIVGRVVAGVVAATALATASPALVAAQAAQAPETGLVRRSDGPCSKGFEVHVRGIRRGCTHPDPAPTGVDAKKRDGAVERQLKIAAETAAGFASSGNGTLVPCYGDGQSGNRVQAIYVSATDQTDRFSEVAPGIPS